MTSTSEDWVVKRTYSATKSGRPYLRDELESGRVTTRLLPMPTLEELLANAGGDEASQLQVVQVYARGFQAGASWEKLKRNDMLANLVVNLSLSLGEIETVTGLSREYLIALLRSRGLTDREIGVQVNKRRRR